MDIKNMEHPKENKKNYNKDLFNDFCDQDETAEKIKLLTLELIAEGVGMKDNVWDECSRSAANATAELLGVNREIVKYFNPSAL